MINEDPGPYEIDFEYTSFSYKNRLHLRVLKQKRKESLRRKYRRKLKEIN